MKRAIMLVAAIAALNVFAAAEWRNGERVSLWPSEQAIPDFQEGQIGAMDDEVWLNSPWSKDPKKKPDFKPEEHRMPYLEWFEAPTNSNGGCMILVSGGSYEHCCDLSLIKLWKETFTALGFQTVNLVYRTPRAKDAAFYRSGWQDGQRAVRLVRADAKKRGFDPEKIGAIGMSAGGHLVTMLATSALTPAYGKVDALDELPCHINWCIANAPAYNASAAHPGGGGTMYDGLTKPGSPVAKCFAFDEKTCPISFHHGGLDPYSPNGSAQCYRELRKRKIPSELHLYADKGHGAFGLDRAVEFMRQMGYVGDLGDGVGIGRRFMPTNTKRTEKEMLWPADKMPGREFADRTKLSPTDGEMQVADPYLVWYIPEKTTTKAIQVVLPGGGYSICNYNGEGTPVAYYLNGKGMTTVVVMYRCPRPKGQPKHYLAWQDAQRAIRMVRAEAPARGLDPDCIGTMGFSAGGHLTLMTALSSKTNAYEAVDEIDKLSCSVQWACPIYPAYALTDGADDPNTTGGNDDSAVPVPEFAFDAGTPPMCFMHGDADGWAAMNSVKCWEKLRLMGVQSDLHTLAKRGHCFQFCPAPGTGSYTWLDRIWEFLTAKGFNK